MEDLARVDHLLEPGAAFGRALNREQERQKALLVGRAGVLAQCLAEGQVLGLAVRREAVGVGREESEGRLLVLAVLGEVEVHLAHDVPGRVQAPEEVLDRGLRFGLLGGEGLACFRPEREHDGGCQVFGAGHHRSGSGQAPRCPWEAGGIPRGVRRDQVCCRVR